MLSTSEASLRPWLSSLPVALREDLLRLCLLRLGATLAARAAEAATSLPVLAASCTEVLHSPQFSRLSVSEHLQWHRDSRMRVLHLLHSSSSSSSVRSLEFPCYSGRAFLFERPHFSERFVLTGVLGRLGLGLRRLVLPGVCDDEMLAHVGTSCPNIKEIDLEGSFALTDQGIRY